jgi:hypothetical protein
MSGNCSCSLIVKILFARLRLVFIYCVKSATRNIFRELASINMCASRAQHAR